MLVALLLGVAGVGCEQAPAPGPVGPTFNFAPAPPPAMVSVRVDGQVIDVDSERPVPGALVTSAGPSAVTDAQGRFGFSADLQPTWTSLRLVVTRSGYERSERILSRDQIAGSAVWMYPTLTIRPGDLVEAQIAPAGGFTGSFCSFGIDDIHCRRVVVESPAGGPIEIEVIPVSGSEDVGLTTATAFTSYDRRVTVTGREIWLVGSPAHVTLRASSR